MNLFDPENEIDNCFIGTIPHPFFIPHHFELLERYNRKIWENLPLKLCERALVTNNEEVITWADLLTIDASPADSIHARIQEHFKTNGVKGWLSTNVVNAYSFAAVRLRNTALGFEKFGFLDCNTTTKILSGNYKSGRVTKSLVKGSSRMLRNDLLFPVIYQAHFMLIWFSKKDSHFIIFDFLSQKHSFLLNGINQHLYFFLNSVEPIARVKVAERCLVAQRDSISCGVCVCMTVDALLFEKRNYLNLDYHFINNFRFWITYFLIITSGKNRLEFNKYVKFDFCKGVVGLQNFDNTCWFNAVYQACAYVIKQVSLDVSADSLKALHDLFPKHFEVLYRLMLGSNIETNLLKETIKQICVKCNFKVGEQQDAEEFFSMSDVKKIFNTLDFPLSVTMNSSTACENCDSTAHDHAQQIDIILPLFESIKNGDFLNKYLQCFLEGNELTLCASCQSCSVRTNFHIVQLPDILIICLGRSSAKTKNKCVYPDINLTIRQHGESESIDCSYDLTSVITHSGESINFGHYECFLFRNYPTITKLNDMEVLFTCYEERKAYIAKTGYLFFYILKKRTCYRSKFLSKKKTSICSPIKISSRESVVESKLSESQIQPPFSQKKVERYVEFTQTGLLENASGKLWEKSKVLLPTVVRESSLLLNTPLLTARKTLTGFRHCMFLQSQNKALRTYNRWHFQCTDISLMQFVIIYVRSALCCHKQVITMDGDWVLRRDTKPSLYLKKEFYDLNSELAKSLLSADHRCNEYVAEVLEYEAYTLLIMRLLSMNYQDTSKHLNVPVKTYDEHSQVTLAD